jgi:uncharacterized protein
VSPHSIQDVWNQGPSGLLARTSLERRIDSMKSRSMAIGAERVFVLILDQGEDAFKAITEFADMEGISGASISAIGAFEHAKVGWFDLTAKTYRPIAVEEQAEVLSLVGDVAVGDNGKASLHLHAVLGLKDGSVRGGHFMSGVVRPTLEVTIRETAADLRKTCRSRHRADQHLSWSGAPSREGTTSVVVASSWDEIGIRI